MIQDILLNPNVAYLLVVLAGLLVFLAILSPGTGLIEVAAVIVLGFAAYSIFNLPINYWALGLLVLGAVPFLLALRRTGRKVFLVISLVALVVGSMFLFDKPGWQPAVNPFMALAVSAFLVGFIWILATKALEAERARPVHDLEILVGEVGEAKTQIFDEGSVQVAGELWSARSKQSIPSGTKVRVIGREGFYLDVEAIDEQ